MILWGIATFGLVPPVQMRVMKIAHEAPGLASSINVGAFNLGNALGAAAGGWVLSQQLGYAAVSYTGAGLAGLGYCWYCCKCEWHRPRILMPNRAPTKFKRPQGRFLFLYFLLLYFYCFILTRRVNRHSILWTVPALFSFSSAFDRAAARQTYSQNSAEYFLQGRHNPMW